MPKTHHIADIFEAYDLKCTIQTDAATLPYTAAMPPVEARVRATYITNM